MSAVKSSHRVVFLLLFIALYLVLIALGNGRELFMTLKSKSPTTLHPRIYYTDGTHPYDEKHAADGIPSNRYRYRFNLPLHTVTYLRIDPAASARRTIEMYDMYVVENHWWYRRTYKLDTQRLKPIHDIGSFQHQGNRIVLTTVGNDPYLQMPYRTMLTSESFRPHLFALATALLLTLLSLFLWKLRSDFEEHKLSVQAKTILYALFFSFLLFKGWYYKSHIRFGYPPDEGAHLSYIAYVHEHHEFFPKFESMFMLNNKKAGNYLSHPPLYYEIEHLVYDPSHSFKDNVDHFRTMSFFLYAFSVVLLLFIGFHSPLSLLGHLVFLSFIASIPMYAYIGGSISNDNLAFLAAAVFLTGFYRLIQEIYDMTTWLLIALGALLAFFSKLTAALLVFLALSYFFIVRLFQRKLPPVNKTVIILFGLATIPMLLYQSYIVWHYHALVPTFNHTHPQQYLHSPFFTPEAYRHYLTPLEWLERMWHYIQGGWFGIHSHHSFVKSSLWDAFGLVILHLGAFVAFVLPCPQGTRHFCRLGKYTLLAVFTVLIIQYGFSYKAHLHSGYLGGLQPRYLLPFMVGFAIMASVLFDRFRDRFWFNIAVIGLCIDAIYSDFFYFLLYYR